MKKYLLIAAAMTLALGTSAWAATPKAQIKASDIAEILVNDADNQTLIIMTKAGKKFRLANLSDEQRKEIVEGVQVASANTEAAAKAASTATPKPLQPAAAAATTSAKAEKAEEKKSPWGGSFLNITSAGVEDLHNGEASVSLYNRPTLQYKLESGLTLKLRPSFTISYDMKESVSEYTLGDVILEASKGGLKLPADIGLYLAGRYYLPTSSASRDAGSVGTLWGYAAMTKKLGSVFKVTYEANPRFYLQQRASNVEFDELSRVTNEPSGNRSLRYIHSLGMGQQALESLGFYQKLSLDHGWRYDDPGVGVEDNTSMHFGWEIGADISILDNLSLTLALDQRYDTKGDEGFSFFKTSEMSYTALTNVSF